MRLHTVVATGRSRVDIEELGTAESILENRGYLQQAPHQLLRKGAIPADDQWGGWLGRYQRAVSRAANDLQLERQAIGIER